MTEIIKHIYIWLKIIILPEIFCFLYTMPFGCEKDCPLYVKKGITITTVKEMLIIEILENRKLNASLFLLKE